MEPKKSKRRQVTLKQIEAIRFCEDILGVRYKGNRENFKQVSRFLTEYLQEASTKYAREKDKESIRLRNFYDTYGDVVSKHKNRRG